MAVSLLSIHWAEIKVWLRLHLSSGPLYLLLSSFWRSSFVSGHIREGVLLGTILDFFFLSKSNKLDVGGRESGGLGGQVSGECVISLVLSLGSKDLKWQTGVTVQLQPRVLFGKQRIVYPGGVRADQPQRRGFHLSWLPLFIHFVSSPLILQIGLAKKGACLFHLRFSH